jgi:predicted nucleotidyltransferase
MENDFLDMIECLNRQYCRYIVVGGMALAFNGYVRNTGDMDIFVEPDKSNSEKVFNALLDFGAPLHDVNKDDFSIEGTIFQIGVPPVRIDIITKIDGVSFNDAYSTKKIHEINGMKVPYLSIDMLLVNKAASGRAKDLMDIDELKKL